MQNSAAPRTAAAPPRTAADRRSSSSTRRSRSVRGPGENPIGQRVRIGAADNGPWYTIVGIVGDVRQTTLAAEQPFAIYLPEVQWVFPDGAMSLVIRSQWRPGDGHSGRATRHLVGRPTISRSSGIATMATLVAGTEAQRTSRWCSSPPCGEPHCCWPRPASTECFPERSLSASPKSASARRSARRAEQHPRPGIAPGHDAHRCGRGSGPPRRSAAFRA